MTFKIKAYGRLADAVGEEFQLPATNNLNELHNLLKAYHPVFSEVPYRISVNHSLLHGDSAISLGDEIAVLPPFSGG
jgi:molybdopterin converting factor small subunit